MKLYVGAVAFSLIGGLLSHFLKIEAGAVAGIASFAVLLLGASAVAVGIGDWRTTAFVLVYCAGVEIAGVLTGFPFGRYHYTEAWSPLLPLPGGHVFPVALPLAWLMVGGGSWLAIGRWIGGWQRIALSAVVTMLIDVPLEDLMVRGLKYWQWDEPGPIFGAPVQNSVAWLACGVVCAVALGRGQEPDRSISGSLILSAYCLLMGEIAFIHGLTSGWIWLVLAAAFLATELAWRRQKKTVDEGT